MHQWYGRNGSKSIRNESKERGESAAKQIRRLKKNTDLRQYHDDLLVADPGQHRGGDRQDVVPSHHGLKYNVAATFF